MTILEAVFLGVIQGLTEFLPVSSSGHLVIAQTLLERTGSSLPSPDSPEMIAFDLIAHVGTLVSIFAVFFSEALRFASGLARQDRLTWKFALWGVAATVVTVGVVLPVNKVVEAQFARPLVVGICWLVTGGVLFATTCVRPGTRDMAGFTFFQAIIIGLTQAVAVLPGISRSGSTISAALLLGLDRRLAARFSFLIAVPIILGAAADKLKDLFKDGYHPDWAILVTGFFTSAAVGYLGLVWLLAAIRKLKLNWFAYYCWLIGAATLIAVAAGEL